MFDGEQLPTIRAARVQLRWLTDDDVPGLFEIFSDPEVVRYWSTPPYASEEDAAALLAQIRDCFANRTLFQWGVALGERAIGTCTLFHVHAANRRAEIGFALRRDHWGQGFMSEAVRALLGFAFSEPPQPGLGLKRIEADVDPGNLSSLRLLERLGFQREGLLRERWRVAGGVQDAVVLGLLARELTAP